MHNRWNYNQEEAFWSRVKIAGPDECWEWQGKRQKKGYGQLPFTSWENRKAHRYSYYLNIDKNFDRSLDVCHSCDNPPCVNPNHLWLGTRKDNLKDMLTKGRGKNQNKTHCKHGHAWIPENIYIHGKKRKNKYCKLCVRIRQREGLLCHA